MKRKGLIWASLAIAGLIVLLALLGMFNPRWHRLPKAGRVRVFIVTTGTKHSVRFPARSWGAHFSKFFAQPIKDWTVVGFFCRPYGGSGVRGTGTQTVIWFQTEGYHAYTATLTTDDGQKFTTQGANGPTTDGYGMSGMPFPVLLPNDRTLHLDVTFDETPLHFEIANPAYHSSQTNL